MATAQPEQANEQTDGSAMNASRKFSAPMIVTVNAPAAKTTAPKSSADAQPTADQSQSVQSTDSNSAENASADSAVIAPATSAVESQSENTASNSAAETSRRPKPARSPRNQQQRDNKTQSQSKSNSQPKRARRKNGRSKPEASNPIDNSTMKLQRFLAATGAESRRNCAELIETGRVTVDGEVVTNVTRTVDVENSEIRLDGEVLRLGVRKYFLLNKPKGYLCTNKDPRGRARAVDLIPDQRCRLFTVGRLDENSEGLLLVTNDGELANRLAHPKYHVRRSYRIQVAGVPNIDTIKQLKEGLYFTDGFFKVHGYKRLKTKGKSSFLEIELNQGRNREIRRLFARVGHKVMQLQRVSFGPLKLGRLAPGKSRPLSPTEVKSLMEFVENRTAARKPRSQYRHDRDNQRGAAGEGSATADGSRSSKPRRGKSASRRGAAAHQSGQQNRRPKNSKSGTKSTGNAKSSKTGKNIKRKRR